MTDNTDMQAALQACVDVLLHDGVPTEPEHPKRLALNAAEAALAARDAQAGSGTDERAAFAIAMVEAGYHEPEPSESRVDAKVTSAMVEAAYGPYLSESADRIRRKALAEVLRIAEIERIERAAKEARDAGA